MKRKISQIRDISIIEKELFDNPIGILAVTVNEKIIQTAATFIYHDKNIYFFFKDQAEIYLNANLENNGSFMILKNHNMLGSKSNLPAGQAASSPLKYHTMSISISGSIKKVDDTKVLNDLRKSYLKKYSKNSSESEISSLAVSLFIDTEEFLAFDEQGER